MKYLLQLLYCAVACLLFAVNVDSQVTKTLNGTVRYQSGMSETKFSTPNGDVVVNLPQSMRGSVITGTVSTQPAGKTEKEKSRNLKELMKMTLNLDGQKIPLSSISESGNIMDWIMKLDRPGRKPMELLNVSGTKIAEVSLPPVLPALERLDWQRDRDPFLTTPSNVLVKGDALNVYTDQQFSPGEKFVLTDSKGQHFTLTPICLSSQQAVMNVPEEVSPGNCTVSSQTINQRTKLGANLVGLNFTSIDINLTSPNTNLRPGELSSVQVLLNTGTQTPVNYNIDPKITDKDSSEAMQIPIQCYIDPKITDRDSSEAMQIPIQISIDLRNLNPNIVTMEGGNLQRVYNATVVNLRNDGLPTNFQIRRNITGNAVGNFSVSATLHEDYNTSTDPFRPQLNVLNTPEDFNAWANALKKDLKEYAAIQKNENSLNDPLQKDIVLSSIRANAQRAIDNMPLCSSPEQLDECKAVAYSLIQPLNVPKGAATMWLSGFEAWKAAIKAIPSTLSGNLQLIDWEVIKKGLEYTGRMGKQLVDYGLKNETAKAEQLIGQIHTQGESKETLQLLDETLRALNVQMNKVQTGMPVVMKNLLPGGILFSTKFSPPGMNMDAEVINIAWGFEMGYDVIKVDWHFTGDIAVTELSIRVNWRSKDGKKSSSADYALPINKPGQNFHYCDTFPIWVHWPDGFTASGIVKPLPKDELDLDNVKVIVFVNGKKVGEGKLED